MGWLMWRSAITVRYSLFRKVSLGRQGEGVALDVKEQLLRMGLCLGTSRNLVKNL